MKLSLSLPPGWTVLGTILTGALLVIGAQVPTVAIWLVGKMAPAVIQAAGQVSG